MSAGNNPSAIVFDLYDTLVPGGGRDLRDAVSHAMARDLGVDPEAFAEAIRDSFDARCSGALGDLHQTVFHLAEQLGTHPERAALDAAAERRLELHRELLAPSAEVLETLDRLRRSGYRLGLISDCSIETPLLWHGSGLAKYFDVTVFSCEIRARKPDPALYRRAAAGLGVRPEDCLYVGDGASDELAGAERAGMNALQISVEHVDARTQTDRRELYGVRSWHGRVIHDLADLPTLLEKAVGADHSRTARSARKLDAQVAYWDAAASDKVFTHPLHQPWLADTKRDAAILDVGCGYGRIIAELERLGFRDLAGADISPAMIARAQQDHPDARFTVLTDPPALAALPGASMDLVVLFAVLTCIPGDDAQQALLAELNRVLKPGGRLYLSDLLLQDDPRNLERYARGAERHGTYGVFETGDGAICRHHSRTHLDELLAGFEIDDEREISVATMNGHTSAGIQILARKPAQKAGKHLHRQPPAPSGSHPDLLADRLNQPSSRRDAPREPNPVVPPEGS